MGLFSKRKTVFVDADILVIGGGMACCGATAQIPPWGRDKKNFRGWEAHNRRSGAAAPGPYSTKWYQGLPRG